MGHDDQRERRLAVGNRDVGWNLGTVPGLVGDVLHVRESIVGKQWVAAPDLMQAAPLDQVVRTGVAGTEVGHDERRPVP